MAKALAGPAAATAGKTAHVPGMVAGHHALPRNCHAAGQPTGVYALPTAHPLPAVEIVLGLCDRLRLESGGLGLTGTCVLKSVARPHVGYVTGTLAELVSPTQLLGHLTGACVGTSAAC